MHIIKLSYLQIIPLRTVYNLIRRWKWRNWKDNTQSIYFRIPSPHKPINTRIYSASNGKKKPLIVYFHGGGWALGDLNSHHPLCQVLHEQTGNSIIAVDYRLAPKYSFPAAHDDALNAMKWIIKNIEKIGLNNGCVILAGDSAGANLATSTCIALQPIERCKVNGQILLYPVVDHYSAQYFSYLEKGKGYTLTSNLMRSFWDNYHKVTTKDEPIPIQLTPIRASNLADLPPTLIITAENDPLRDEAIAYANTLSVKGVMVQYQHFEQAEHGFACSSGITQDFNFLLDDIQKWMEDIE